MAGEQDMDSMYAYYDAKLKKYATGGFDVRPLCCSWLRGILGGLEDRYRRCCC